MGVLLLFFLFYLEVLNNSSICLYFIFVEIFEGVRLVKSKWHCLEKKSKGSTRYGGIIIIFFFINRRNVLPPYCRFFSILDWQEVLGLLKCFFFNYRGIHTTASFVFQSIGRFQGVKISNIKVIYGLKKGNTWPFWNGRYFLPKITEDSSQHHLWNWFFILGGGELRLWI